MKIQVIPTAKGFVLETTNSALSLSVREDGQLGVIASKTRDLTANDVQKENASFVDAFLGVVCGVTKGTHYLILVDQSTPIGNPKQVVARSVNHVQIVPFPAQNESDADRLQVEYIERAIHNIPFLYFSHTRNIVHTVQMQHQQKSSPSVRDSFFVWNWKFLEPLFEANVPNEWIHPLIQGLVACKENVRVVDMVFDIVLITRRAVAHQGTRFNCRGLDSEGNAANFCETEQILLFRKEMEGTVTSFVQVRGSVPTAWTQRCSLIPIHQRAKPDQDWSTRGLSLFFKHMTAQMPRYGKQLVLVNLIDRKGKSNSSKDQAALGAVFESHVQAMQKGVSSPSAVDERGANQEKQSPPRFVWWDFHHETKGSWENLSKLLREVHPELNAIGFFVKKSRDVVKLQSGCFRVNCMDNLDRTNVVQSILARTSLLNQLSTVSARQLTSSRQSVFDSGYPELEEAFKPLWADNADAVSLAYAGSMALKTDFTRTGKRTGWGKIQDGLNSTMRLIMNNFLDAYKQDEIDVLLRDNSLVHPVLLQMDGKDESLASKRRWGLLALLTLGYFTPAVQQRVWQQQTGYLVILTMFAAVLVAKQASERPKFFRK